jgi:uncharacterized protein
MEELLAISQQLIQNVSTGFVRSLNDSILWDNRLIGIKGAKGTGKTTLLLQHLKASKLSNNEKVYLSLDDIYFINNALLDIGKRFYETGGKLMVLDEVHKYPQWAREIKNLNDRYPALQIIFTASSIIEISKMEGDLSRRALMYELKGLSFREYLEFVGAGYLPVLKLQDILSDDFSHAETFPPNFKPLMYFDDYIRYGYYPFAFENKDSYYQRIRQITRSIVEYDMAEIKGFDIRQAKKMLKLVYIIAQQVPFKPNLSSLSEKTGIHRNSINNYLFYLEEARLISLLQHTNYSVASLQKPEKIFLENTNSMFALSEQQPEIGSIRETFFYNQVSFRHQVNQSPDTDFLVDSKFTFEIGGPNKKSKQIKDLNNAWIVKDNIELKVGNTVPLWMFGFLY